jgi:DNA-binding MarR family transcriptional regulator
MTPVEVKKIDQLPLSALLSQVLVVFTIEFDNEFEHQVPHRTTNHGSATGSVPWLVSLATIVSQLDVELFDSLPILGYGLFSHGPEKPPRAQATGSLATSARLSLPSLLCRVLLWFTIEFEQASEVSLDISANILRLLSEGGIPLRDLPRMAAVSKEAVAMAMSFLSSRGYVVVASKPGGNRGKILLLTPKGRNAQEAYSKLVGTIEQRWQTQLGDGTVRLLRNSLTRLVG